MEREDVRDLSVRELTAQLSEQLPRLVRDEVALAKAELFARGKQAKAGGSMLAAAAVVGLGGWLVMVAAAIAGLARALPVWGSALIVALHWPWRPAPSSRSGARGWLAACRRFR